MENLMEYFEKNDGTAVLSTADAAGKVNSAIFSKPHVMGEGVIALLLADRLTHKNLQENPSAVCLFLEKGPGWKGKRLYLKKTKEERNTDLARSLVRRTNVDPEQINVNLVFFEIEKVLPLVGD